MYKRQGEAWGRLCRKVVEDKRLELTTKFMADVDWCKWFVNYDRWKRGERLTVPFAWFLKQKPSRRWYSDVLYQAVGGYCLETRWWCRYDLSEEERSRTVRSRARVDNGSL